MTHKQIQEVQSKDDQTHNIKADLNMTQQFEFWWLTKFLQLLFSFKLLNRFPLLKQGIITIHREGFRQFFLKTKCYLSTHKDVVTFGLVKSNYDEWIKKNEFTVELIEEIKKTIKEFSHLPKISIIMPVYNVSQIWLEKAINSVLNQIYDNWELCIADDASTKQYIRKTLEKYAREEERIKIKYLKKNQGIAGASNEALSLATGDFICLLDNDDELSADALYENVKLINKHPEADMIYSDEDKLDIKGKRRMPFFKPDWSPDLFLCAMYTCHLGLYRKSIIDELGGFRKGFEGSQDYDLVLRFTEMSDNIFHIPKVLYHWRMINTSAAANPAAKEYAYASARKALIQALKRRGVQGFVGYGANRSHYHVDYNIIENKKVSIIISVLEHHLNVHRCLRKAIEQSGDLDYEFILVVNAETENKLNLNGIPRERLKCVVTEGESSLPLMNNYGARHATGDFLVFLSPYIEITQINWIVDMIKHAQNPEIGAIGLIIADKKNKIIHAGIALDKEKVIASPFAGLDYRDKTHYHGFINDVRNCSAVTSDCVMVRNKVFIEIGGFDEINFSSLCSDIDFSLKLRKNGYRVLLLPIVLKKNYDRGIKNDLDLYNINERKLLKKKWAGMLDRDPYFNYESIGSVYPKLTGYHH